MPPPGAPDSGRQTVVAFNSLARRLDQIEAREGKAEPEAEPAMPPDLTPLLPWLSLGEVAEVEIAYASLRYLAAAEAERRRRCEPTSPEARRHEVEAAATIVALARLADLRRAYGRDDLAGEELLAALEKACHSPPSVGWWWR
jgi:hypothetical protein